MAQTYLRYYYLFYPLFQWSLRWDIQDLWGVSIGWFVGPGSWNSTYTTRDRDQAYHSLCFINLLLSRFERTLWFGFLSCRRSIIETFLFKIRYGGMVLGFPYWRRSIAQASEVGSLTGLRMS